MCLAVIGKIISCDDFIAKVQVDTIIVTVSVGLIEEPRPCEYVLIHAGCAITKVEEAEAKEIEEALAMYSRQ